MLARFLHGLTPRFTYATAHAHNVITPVTLRITLQTRTTIIITNATHHYPSAHHHTPHAHHQRARSRLHQRSPYLPTSTTRTPRIGQYNAPTRPANGKRKIFTHLLTLATNTVSIPLHSLGKGTGKWHQ